jgi:hypothetical protein
MRAVLSLCGAEVEPTLRRLQAHFDSQPCTPQHSQQRIHAEQIDLSANQVVSFRLRLIWRNSIINSERIVRFAASSGEKPKSMKTLPLDSVTSFQDLPSSRHGKSSPAGRTNLAGDFSRRNLRPPSLVRKNERNVTEF